jgi:hypothetical protein
MYAAEQAEVHLLLSYSTPPSQTEQKETVFIITVGMQNQQKTSGKNDMYSTFIS